MKTKTTRGKKIDNLLKVRLKYLETGKSPRKRAEKPLPKTYKELTDILPLKLIRNPKELYRFLKMRDRFNFIVKLNKDQSDYLTMITYCIESYEDTHYPYSKIFRD